MNRYLIINADDLGLSKSFNAGILDSAINGFLTSTCLRINGTAVEAAIKEILPQCPNLGVGLHLNLVEGKTTRQNISKSSLLYKIDGTYALGFGGLFFGRKNNKLLQEIEDDYRDQIERALKLTGLDHFNSHQHSHGIPEIFEIVCRLAKEYNIKYVRLPVERPHYTPPFSRHCHTWYGINLLKLGLLNSFASRNWDSARKYGVKTNDSFIGISYTEFMDKETLYAGLKAIPDKATIVEALFHPVKIVADKDEMYLIPELRDYIISRGRSIELATLKEPEAYKNLKRLGFNLTNYRNLSNQDALVIVPKFRQEQIAVTPYKGFIIMDETPFYHPEYLYRLFTECKDFSIQGAAIVALPNGGVLKKYLLKHWRDLGLKELFLLGMFQIKLQIFGRFPRFIRGDFDSSIESVLKRFNVPYRIVTKVNDEDFLNYLSSFDPDIVLSANSLIFGEKLINIPKVACINRHSAILPACGGILPVFRAVEQGHTFTGASVHYVTKGIDKGEVLSRKYLPLFPKDSLNRLYGLCFVLSFEATMEAIIKLREGNSAKDNVEDIEASYFSFPTKEDWKRFRKNGGRFI